jgi:hypothetical protein
MANIRISAVEIEVSNKTLEIYDSYINASNEKSRNTSQADLEKIMAPVFGAKRIAGNPRLIPDFYIEPLDLIPSSSIFQTESDGRLNIEAKFKRSKKENSTTETTIGTSAFSSVLSEIKQSRQSINTTKSLFNYLESRLSSSGKVFDWLSKNAPIFHEQAYNKAKNLTIFTKTEGSILAYQIYFPRDKFKSGIFGADYSASKTGKSFTFLYYLNNSFERSLLESVQKSIVRVSEDRVKDLKYDNPTKPIKIQYGRKTKSTIEIYTARTNSIPTANITTRIKEKQTTRRAPSILDITMLVRGRTRLKMRRGAGTPNPPKIFERSSTFRGSIQAVANMQSNTINYFYIPYYDALERYGYQINDLVESSIRDIARERLGQEFILRKNTQPIN